MRAAFLDRDGVINIDKGYVHTWPDLEVLPGTVEALQKLVRAGFALIIVTNQSGIARGYFTEAQYQKLMLKLIAWLGEKGVNVTGIYHCPHHPEGHIKEYTCKCNCRKPRPGMLLQAEADHKVDLVKSIMIGNAISDIEAARAAGIGSAFLVGFDQEQLLVNGNLADGMFPTLRACVDYILKTELGPTP